jgi:hypothetical protein
MRILHHGRPSCQAEDGHASAVTDSGVLPYRGASTQKNPRWSPASYPVARSAG